MSSRNRKQRGTGTGADYDPALHVMDVPSRGLSHRVLGWHTNRVHHLLSDLEYWFFLVMEWQREVTDFREQYPLPLEETRVIADRLGVKHPTHPRTKALVQMTTDALVTVTRGHQIREVARTLKYADALASMRTLEKFEIERLYYQAHQMDWGIVTERDIPMILAKNVEFVHRARWVSACAPLTEVEMKRVARTLKPEILKGTSPLRDLTSWCDDTLGFTDGTSLRVVRHMIANRHLPVDMGSPIKPTEPLTLLHATKKRDTNTDMTPQLERKTA